MFALLSLLMLQAVSTPPQPAAAQSAQACTAANSIRTNVLAITKAPERFVNRCVTASGPAGGVSMYSGIEGLYLSQRFGPDGNIPPSGMRHRIGVYSEENAIRRAAQAWRGPTALAVTGRVDTCARMKERAERRAREAGQIPIIMMSGYCHYYGGPVVRASAWSADPSKRYERLVGERARTRFGNLIPAPADWPTRPLLLALAEKFRNAVVSGDRSRLAELHDVGPESTNAHDAKMLAFLLDPDSPFADLRLGRSSPPALFIFNSQTSPKAYAEAVEYPGGTVCFCRRRDCSRLWPISLNDAVNSVDKPYVCTKIEPRDGTSRKAGFRTLVGEDGLAEPARTAFRRD